MARTAVAAGAGAGATATAYFDQKHDSLLPLDQSCRQSLKENGQDSPLKAKILSEPRIMTNYTPTPPGKHAYYVRDGEMVTSAQQQLKGSK